jgi:hypothetical protein
MLKVSLPLFLVLSFLLPLTLMAQELPPPKCCPHRGPESIAADMATSIQGQFVMSDQMLRSQGITRSQYLNQLSTIVFPNKAVDIVLTSRNPFGQSRLEKANVKDLDTVDQIAVTDGALYVGVSFVR